MTEPLIVDTDQLDSASKILGRAAGAIPAPLPKLSVPGTDPLSLAVATGAVQVEAPIAALSGIKADATTTAENIEVAGQRYRETDETLAQKATQQQFEKDVPGAANGAPTPPSIHSGPGVPPPPGFWDNWFTNKDVASSFAATAVGAKAEFPKYFVEQALKGPASGAPPSWSKTAFVDEIKGVKGVTRAGGVLAAPFLVWNIHDNMKRDGNSIWQATAREGGGFLTGAAAGAVTGTLVGGPVGTVVGVIIGGAVGMGAGKFIDKAWEPAANFIGKLIN